MQITHNGITLEVTNQAIQENILNLVLGGIRGHVIPSSTPKKEKKKKFTKHRWTDQDKEVLRKCLVNKIPLKEIVKHLDYKFTKNGVNAQAYQQFPELIKAMTGNPVGKHLGINKFEN